MKGDSELDVPGLVDRLGLVPHPEGGYYREIHRSAVGLPHPRRGGAQRAAGTAIYYLLPTGRFSAWHVVHGSDEGWHRYAGGDLALHTLDPATGRYERRVLSGDLARGEPTATVPAGVWQAAAPVTGSGHWVLCGCTVAPGFDFADFEMADRDTLERRFPDHRGIVAALTRG